MRRSEAIEYRKNIETAMQSLDGNTALRMLEFYPAWDAGKSYTAGFKVRHCEKLWRCIQAHMSQEDWEPSTSTASLWT